MGRAAQKVAGILLAAGASRRMGRIKQLLPLGENTLIERVLAEALHSQLDRVILVLGHRAEEIKSAVLPLLEDRRVKTVENRRFREGMSTSIIAGLREIEKTHRHAMVLLGDMPFVRGEMIDLLIVRYLESGLPIGAVRGKERPLHPVIFCNALYPDLLSLEGDVGARAILSRYGDRVCLVEPEPSYDSRDMDTPEDYAKFHRE